MTIEKITDHSERGLKRLPLYLKNAENFRALISIIGDQIQDLEDAGDDLLNKRLFEDAEGVQLDTQGKHLGEPRLGRGDVDYLAGMDVRIDVNDSSGEAPRLARIAKDYSSADSIIYFHAYPAGFVTEVIGGIYSDEGLLNAMFDAKLGGVDMDLIGTVAAADIPFVASALILDGEAGATTAADTFDVGGSTTGILAADVLRIYSPDTDAGDYVIQTIGATDVTVLPATLTFPRSSIDFEVIRKSPGGGFGGLIAEGVDGAVAVDGVTFTSAGATLIADGLISGDTIYLTGVGLFEVDTVDLETQVTFLTPVPGVPLSGLTWQAVTAIEAGILSRRISSRHGNKTPSTYRVCYWCEPTQEAGPRQKSYWICRRRTSSRQTSELQLW